MAVGRFGRVTRKTSESTYLFCQSDDGSLCSFRPGRSEMYDTREECETIRRCQKDVDYAFYIIIMQQPLESNQHNTLFVVVFKKDTYCFSIFLINLTHQMVLQAIWKRAGASKKNYLACDWTNHLSITVYHHQRSQLVTQTPTEASRESSESISLFYF